MKKEAQHISSYSNNTQLMPRPTLGEDRENTEIKVEESNYPLDVKSSFHVLHQNGQSDEVGKGVEGKPYRHVKVNETSVDTNSKNLGVQTMETDQVPGPFKNSILTGRHKQDEFADYYIKSESQPSQLCNTKRCRNQRCATHGNFKKKDPPFVLATSQHYEANQVDDYDSPTNKKIDYKTFKGVAKQSSKIRQRYQKTVDQQQLLDSRMASYMGSYKNYVNSGSKEQPAQIHAVVNTQNMSGVETQLINSNHPMKIEESDRDSCRQNTQLTQAGHFQNKRSTMGFKSDMAILNQSNPVKQSNIKIALDYEEIGFMQHTPDILSPQTEGYLHSSNASPAANGNTKSIQKDLQRDSIALSTKSKKSNEISDEDMPREFLKSILEGQQAGDQHHKIDQIKTKMRSKSLLSQMPAQIHDTYQPKQVSRTFIKQLSPTSQLVEKQLIKQERNSNFINIALSNKNSNIIKRSDQKKKDLIENLKKMQNAMDYIEAIQQFQQANGAVRQANQSLEINIQPSENQNKQVSDYFCTEPFGTQATPITFSQKIKEIQGTEFQIASGEQSQTFEKIMRGSGEQLQSFGNKALPTTDEITLNNHSVRSLNNSQKQNSMSLSPRAQAVQVSPQKHTVVISSRKNSVTSKNGKKKALKEHNNAIKITDLSRNGVQNMKRTTVDSMMSQAHSPDQTFSPRNEQTLYEQLENDDALKKQFQYQILNEYFQQQGGGNQKEQISLDSSFTQRLAFKFGGEQNAKKIIENSMVFDDFSKIYQHSENLRKINNMIPSYHREEAVQLSPKQAGQSQMDTNKDVCKVFESKFSKFSHQQSKLYSSDMQTSVDLHVSKIGEDLIGSQEEENTQMDQAYLQQALLRLQNKSREYGHFRKPFKQQSSHNGQMFDKKGARNSHSQFHSMMQNQDLLLNHTSTRNNMVQSQQSNRQAQSKAAAKTALSHNFCERNNRVSVMSQMNHFERAPIISPKSLSKHSQSLVLSKLNLANQIEKLQKQDTKTKEFNFREQSLMEHNQNQQQITVQRIERSHSKEEYQKPFYKSPKVLQNSTQFMVARNGLKSQENENRAKAIQTKNSQIQKLMNKTQTTSAFPSQIVQNLKNGLQIDSSPESGRESSHIYRSSMCRSSNFQDQQEMARSNLRQPKQKLGDLLKYNQDFIEQGIKKMDMRKKNLNSRPTESVKSQSRISFYEFGKSQGISLKNIQSRGNSGMHTFNPIYKHNSQAVNSGQHSNSNMKKISSLLKNKKEQSLSETSRNMKKSILEQEQNLHVNSRNKINFMPQYTGNLTDQNPTKTDSKSSGTRHYMNNNKYSNEDDHQHQIVKIVSKIEHAQHKVGAQSTLKQKSKSRDEFNQAAFVNKHKTEQPNLNKTKTMLMKEMETERLQGQQSGFEEQQTGVQAQEMQKSESQLRFKNQSVNLYLNATNSNMTESTQKQQNQDSSQAQIIPIGDINIVSPNLTHQKQTFKDQLQLDERLVSPSGNSGTKSPGICSIGSQAGPQEIDEMDLLQDHSKITPAVRQSTIKENSASHTHDYIENSQFLFPIQDTNRTNKIHPSQESVNKVADTVEKEKELSLKAQIKTENISSNLMDSKRDQNTGKQFAYQVQIHTNKKDQRAYKETNSFNRKVHSGGNARQDMAPLADYQSSSNQNILSPTMSNPLRNFQQTSHSNSMTSGMTASRQRFNPAPVRNFLDSQKIMISNADIQSSSVQFIKTAGKPKESSKLAKLNFILNTFDKGQHDSLFQQGNFKGVQITGISSRLPDNLNIKSQRSKSTGRNNMKYTSMMFNNESQTATGQTTMNNSNFTSQKNIHSGRYTRNVITEMQIVDEVDQIDESCTQITREDDKKLNESVASTGTKQIIYQSKPGSKKILGQLDNNNSNNHLVANSNFSLGEIGSMDEQPSMQSNKILKIVVDNQTYESFNGEKRLKLNKQASSVDMTEGSPLPVKLQSSYAEARNINQSSQIIDEKSIEHEDTQRPTQSTQQDKRLKVEDKTADSNRKGELRKSPSDDTKGQQVVTQQQSINTALSGTDALSPYNQIKTSVFENVKSSYGDFDPILAPKLDSCHQTQIFSVSNPSFAQPKPDLHEMEIQTFEGQQNAVPKDKWLFPQSMLEEQSELLKVVQKYRKKQRR